MPPVLALIRNRRLGWTSLAFSLASTELFCATHKVALNSRSRLDAAITAGEIAILLALIAGAAGALGIVFDRHKLLGMGAMLAGWVLAGFFGMYVYNI